MKKYFDNNNRTINNGVKTMGLAASQARFLGITARKSNIEYEGQQVNQQRMALAEEVNSLYNKLIALDVPVAPDTTQFYESNYSFEVSNTDGYDGDYIVNSYYQNDDGTYYLNTERTYQKNAAKGTQYKMTSISKDDKGVYTFTDNLGNQHILTADAQNSALMAQLVNSTYGENTVSSDEKFYYYQDEKSGQTYYIPSSQITNESENNTFSAYISTIKEYTEPVVFASATVTFDSNNRMSGITGATNPETGESLNINTEVNTTRTYHSEEYDAALRDYTMSKEEYDKHVADLNAQTESLQQEDKILELRLNQIETEQNELKTELEAVKKVLDTNIETTFKTFNS